MSLGTRRRRRSWIWFLGWREWLPDSWQPVSTDENDGIEICEDERSGWRIWLIGDIYPNRTLHVPRLVELKTLPARVLENKASAWGIHAVGGLAARGAYGASGKGVKVGVLDTGVDASHPDLQGKVADWAEFDSNGEEVPNSQPHDTARHGTHVAGTIAGGRSSGRWIGMAPDAKLAVAIALDGVQGGTDAQVLAGIDWAVDRGVDVLNMSLGGLTLGPEVPSTYTEAILTSLRAGIPLVTAIGNDGAFCKIRICTWPAMGFPLGARASRPHSCKGAAPAPVGR